MKTIVLIFCGMLVAGPSFAQSARGYLEGAGGFDVSSIATYSGTTSGAAAAQVGARVVKHLMAFGEFGRFRDLAPDTTQAQVDGVITSLTSDGSLDLIGTAKMPATYGLGGLRLEVPTHSRVAPYVMSGVGVAHLTPSATFSYSGGTLPNAGPNAQAPFSGQDVTSEIVSAGAFIQPPATSEFMFSLGAGTDIALGKGWMFDTGYRYSRISADQPLNASGLRFGIGYRF